METEFCNHVCPLGGKKEWKMKKETRAERERRIGEILAAMDREYGTEYRCYLNYETPWRC